MPKIHRLSKDVADLIAAGEVVERPASAMKEMIENAIDAGSSKITVEIQHGGIGFMRVTDNGCGILREDVPLAFQSHATSKVAKAEDLDAIYTLGFRGEALASIAAVSKVELLTKTEEEPLGLRYVLEGGEEKLLEEAGCPNGTTIVVRDLFYNTPARLKFLKKDATEGNYVSDIVLKSALAHPEICFRFVKDGKQIFFTSGNGKLLSVVSTLLGKEFAASMIEISYELNHVCVQGLVGLPRFGRPTRNSQYFFINSRYVKAPVMSTALDEAYKNSVMVGKFPAAVLNVQIPPETVDVNVHPSKTEVRFSDEKRIFEAVYFAAKTAIEEKDQRPNLHLPVDLPKTPEEKGEQLGFFKTKLSLHMEQNSNAEKTPAVSPLTTSNDRFENFQRTAGTQTAQLENDKNQFKQAFRPSAKEELSEKTEEKSIGNKKTKKDYLYIGEIFCTYLIVQTKNSVWLIDKHALHERIIFNELKSGRANESKQMLMAPKHIYLNRKEYAAACENLDMFRSSGFDIDDFGDGCLVIRACPMLFQAEALEDIIAELAQGLSEHKNELLTRKMERFYETAACKAAIKGGSAVNGLDADALICRLIEDDSLRYCPHGRPVMIELTRRELEKQFGRIQS